MLALGVIFVLLAVAVILVVLLGGADDAAALDVGGLSMSMSTLSVFLLGALTLLVLVLGAVLVRSGVRSANRRRKDKQQLNRLERELEERDAHRPGGPDGAPSTSTEQPHPDPPPSSTR